MKIYLWYLCVFLVFHTIYGSEPTGKGPAVYIVYMGGPTSALPNPVDLLSTTLLSREENALLHTYKSGFSGFAAQLSEEEAEQIRGHPGVVSVFPDPMLKLQTTRSWDFLLSLSKLHAGTSTSGSSASPSGSKTIIGIFDTGIWPESHSFDDHDMGPVPTRWKGICMSGFDFNSSQCNRKLIGARYYLNQTARDMDGHGTHVASTAGGTPVSNASFYGFASGTAKGGSPTSHLAIYKVCTEVNCPGSAILAAFDDAITDGVDLLSLSLGAEPGDPQLFSTDPIAIGAFHAIQKGITVVCAAGNDGPEPMTVVNVAPWILTVAATTMDRTFESYIVLANGQVFKGGGAGNSFGQVKESPVYPLITGVSAKLNNRTTAEARQCDSGSLDGQKISGKIIICEGDDDLTSKKGEVKGKGGVGIVLISDLIHSSIFSLDRFPLTAVSSKDGGHILTYINSTRNPLGTVVPTKTVIEAKPAPVMTNYSSRGPSTTRNILKPDIAAPGEKVLAAWPDNDPETPPGMRPPQFVLASGTSMACPHVSGVAAAIKSKHPSWSPAAIRSAIMTTAIVLNNMEEPITAHTEEVATPYDCGAGVLNPLGALEPGLVYDMDPAEYILFLCFSGYNLSQIKQIQPSLPPSFACPKDSSLDNISNMNYPSIAVHKDVASTPVQVTRTLTNVAMEANVLYEVNVTVPKELHVTVEPSRLEFSASTVKLSFHVTFSSTASARKPEAFGSITWYSRRYRVRIPFVVSNA